uniref:Uncharacterized protein n=1 Tax=Strongyloides venezuelensis TaxID=75913 RepID=A0A0K0F9M0_STRVS
MAILFSIISIGRSKNFKLKISSLAMLILLFSLFFNVFGNENERALETQLALRFHRAKELTPPSFMKRHWEENYNDDEKISKQEEIHKNICFLDQYKYHSGENFQKNETVIDEIAEIEKTVKAINSVLLEEKFSESKENIINILKTNESPLDKINHINQMMNNTKFTEDEQIQFFNTLSDAIMSSKNN